MAVLAPRGKPIRVEQLNGQAVYAAGHGPPGLLLTMGWRLAAAFVLRLVAALCIALAVVMVVLLAILSISLLAGSDVRTEQETVLLGIVYVALLLALARLAHLAVGVFVDRSPRDH